MGRSNLQGTPWHYEYLSKPSNENRRYKGRCKHYIYPTSNKPGLCDINYIKCMGSSKCNKYKEISNEEFKRKSSSAQSEKRKSSDNKTIRYTNKYVRKLAKRLNKKK
jgi:hypothetical protein